MRSRLFHMRLSGKVSWIWVLGFFHFEFICLRERDEIGEKEGEDKVVCSSPQNAPHTLSKHQFQIIFFLMVLNSNINLTTEPLQLKYIFVVRLLIHN